MADFTIHSIYSSMTTAHSPQDYLHKPDRESWTAWDWLCALNDGLTGDAARERYDAFDRMKEDLQALIAAGSERPAPSEAQMMVRFGGRVRAVFGWLRAETGPDGSATVSAARVTQRKKHEQRPALEGAN
ncbi:MAG: hypothetical protein K6G54_07320 [Oscillospiraceae bacterium]|nr:hypothetical protein [Oscillospiraceae bacterium]